MGETCNGVDTVVEELDRLKNHSGFFEVLQQEFRYLKIFIGCLTKCEEARLTNAVATNLEASLSSLTIEYDGKDWNSLVDSLPDKFELVEPEIAKMSALMLDSLRSMSCSSVEILELVDCLVTNFRDLAHLKCHVLVSVEKQIMVLWRKLSGLRIIVNFFARGCTDHHQILKFLNYAMDMVHNAAFLSLLCLLKGKDYMWHMFLPSDSDVALMFREFYQAPSSSKFEAGRIASNLVDFLLEGSVAHFNDHIDILKEGLMFVINFCIDPVVEEEKALANAGDGEIAETINEVLSLIFPTRLDESKLDVFLLLETIEKVRMKIRNVYVPISNALGFNFPMTDGMGIVHFLSENWKEMVNHNPNRIIFTKHQVMRIHDQIHSLKPFLEVVAELQNVREQIISMVFRADYVISSCLIIDRPIWYDMLRLSDVMEAIELIQKEVQKYSDQRLYDKMSSTEMDSSPIQMRRQANASNLEGPIVGRENESEMIVEKLRRGTTQLDIVSISGMPGLGKTTIAKKVYNDPSMVITSI